MGSQHPRPRPRPGARKFKDCDVQGAELAVKSQSLWSVEVINHRPGLRGRLAAQHPGSHTTPLPAADLGQG